MKVYIDRSATWQRQTVRIFVVDSGPGVHRLWQSQGGDRWSFEDISEGRQTNDAEPTFEMPLEMLEAIVAVAHDILPPSAATDRHLKDAVAVRDRLLTLLEGGK